ncbi:MAG TPA: GspE/PulE family protein [Candidatus Margulisiibacteriota bacterium]|nr:GspE/PulE family protein [Candidatus Margulisiibacteriota bacterium]
MDEKPNLAKLLEGKLNISPSQWQECLEEHKKSALSLVRILISKGLTSEDGLLKILSERLNIPYLKIREEDIDVELVKIIPAKLVTHYNFMPIKEQGGALQIAINDPLDILALDEIKLFLNREIIPFIASQKDILESIKSFYGLGAETLEAMALQQGTADPGALAQEKSKDIKDEAIDPSVIKFLNQILLDAVKQQATDIHFEPFEDDLRVRYRIDGILYEVSTPPTIKNFQSSIASRIKVMASMDIAEKRRPQDGRADIKIEDEVYDLRISVMPTPFGESIGVRILPRSSPITALAGLGLSSQELEILERMISKPHGIILVTGPTGSGKTTTLYACLNRINSSERKILTIEDPIEYKLQEITQMQIEPKIGFTFANALRSMLRHDPNVMMVGEIRDTETAELAVRTSLTGHLVFSTLHTNDAAGAITRLLDMGVDSFLVSSSVILIIAQRLVRLICPHCKEKYTLSHQTLRQFSQDKSFDGVIYHGRGCEKCRFTGYKGRTAIFEMLVISEEIREMIHQRMPSQQIKDKAISLGMKVLMQSGWDKIKEGQTTPEEVIRVAQEEES